MYAAIPIEVAGGHNNHPAGSLRSRSGLPQAVGVFEAGNEFNTLYINRETAVFQRDRNVHKFPNITFLFELLEDTPYTYFEIMRKAVEQISRFNSNPEIAEIVGHMASYWTTPSPGFFNPMTSHMLITATLFIMKSNIPVVNSIFRPIVDEKEINNKTIGTNVLDMINNSSMIRVSYDNVKSFME
uniref:Uncharacterized protein n=1 Tax=Romanomermis culicivorax TaxID=13658 RepID=A0A915I718_ROMCU